jgi:hypothetical protein
MIGHLSLEEQIEADFSRARRKALLRRVRTRLRRDAAPDRLLCFDDVRKITGAMGRIYLGMRAVPVAQIGGSVGRCSEFDRGFMPARASVGERWKRIDRAFRRGEELPPVNLYKTRREGVEFTWVFCEESGCCYDPAALRTPIGSFRSETNLGSSGGGAALTSRRRSKRSS